MGSQMEDVEGKLIDEKQALLSSSWSEANYDGRTIWSRVLEVVQNSSLKGEKSKKIVMTSLAFLNVILGVSLLLTIVLHQHQASTDLAQRARRYYRERALERSNYASNTHLLIMMNNVDRRFCKTLYSALVNGYPAPQIPHYKRPYQKGFQEKIDTYSDYVSNYVAESDLALLTDGYDIWFQLPAKTLFERFHRENTQLILGADKKCYPNKPTSDACTALPESPLAVDVYGPRTDTNYLSFTVNRPRWVNSGTIIGTGSGLKRLVERMNSRMQDLLANKGYVNDQGIIAEVLTNKSYSQDFKIDMTSDLFQTMIWSRDDVIWEYNVHEDVPVKTNSMLPGAERRLNLTDIGFDSNADRLASFWWNRPLMRNIVSNTIPAIIHINGYKIDIQRWWKRTWFAQRQTKKALLEEIANDHGAGAWHSGVFMTYNELCDSYPI